MIVVRVLLNYWVYFMMLVKNTRILNIFILTASVIKGEAEDQFGGNNRFGEEGVFRVSDYI